MKVQHKILIFGTILIFWGLFFWLTGVSGSGYHLEDGFVWFIFDAVSKDHGNGFLATIYAWLSDWLHLRFNPFLWVYLISLYWIGGYSYIFYSLVNIALLSVTFYVLFLCIYEDLGWNIFDALFFVAIAFIGVQTRCYYRIFIAEPIGMFFVAMFFKLAGSNSRSNNSAIKKWLPILLLLLASLTKEAFIVFIPSGMLFLVYASRRKEGRGETMSAVRSNLSQLLVLSSAFIAEIYIILFVVGPNNLGYAGIDSNFFEVGKWWRLVKNSFVTNGYLFLLLWIAFWEARNGLFKPERKKIELLVFAIVLLLPQYFLHYKTGIYERYLFPAILGVALLVTGSSIYFFKNTRVYLQRTFIGLAVLVVIFNGIRMAQYAILFAGEGIETKRMIADFSQYAKQDQGVLIVNNSKTVDFSRSFAAYLSSVFGAAVKVSYYPVGDAAINAMDSSSKKQIYLFSDVFLLKSFYKDRLLKEAPRGNEYDAILFENESSEKLFRKETGILTSGAYHCKVYGDVKYAGKRMPWTFNVYCKNKML